MHILWNVMLAYAVRCVLSAVRRYTNTETRGIRYFFYGITPLLLAMILVVSLLRLILCYTFQHMLDQFCFHILVLRTPISILLIYWSAIHSAIHVPSLSFLLLTYCTMQSFFSI